MCVRWVSMYIYMMYGGGGAVVPMRTDEIHGTSSHTYKQKSGEAKSR